MSGNAELEADLAPDRRADGAPIIVMRTCSRAYARRLSLVRVEPRTRTGVFTLTRMPCQSTQALEIMDAQWELPEVGHGFCLLSPVLTFTSLISASCIGYYCSHYLMPPTSTLWQTTGRRPDLGLKGKGSRYFSTTVHWVR